MAARGDDPALRRAETARRRRSNSLPIAIWKNTQSRRSAPGGRTDGCSTPTWSPPSAAKRAHLITRADLRAALNDIKNRPAPIEANRTFEVVRKLFNWAVEEEILSESPVFKLPKPAEELSRERTLAADELQALWAALESAGPVVRGVFRIMLLSAQRRNEVSHMRWADLDRREGWWNIPPELTKTKRPNRVPVTPAMTSIIEEIEKLKLDPVWVFPRAEGGGPVPETNVTRPFRRLIKV
jgi:integrase